MTFPSIRKKSRKCSGLHLPLLLPLLSRHSIPPPIVFSPSFSTHTYGFIPKRISALLCSSLFKPRLYLPSFSAAQLPPVRSHVRDVEVMLAGRSNVGKSSLLNALLKCDLAHTGQTPGKTQSLNFYGASEGVLSRRSTRQEAIATIYPPPSGMIMNERQEIG